MNILKAEGFKFPALKESDAMFSADTAPEWADGEVCHRYVVCTTYLPIFQINSTYLLGVRFFVSLFIFKHCDKIVGEIIQTPLYKFLAMEEWCYEEVKIVYANSFP